MKGPSPYEIPVSELVDPENLRDPYPQIERIRAVCPVAHNAFGGFHVVSHGEVSRILRDRSMSRDPLKADAGSPTRVLAERVNDIESNMLFADPPAHTRLRGLVNKAFTPRALEAMRPRVGAIADALLDAVAGQASFDLMPAFAGPLPTMVIAEMLGIDPGDHARFKQWSDGLAKGLDPFLADAERAQVQRVRAEIIEFFRGVIASRRGNPGSDLTSGLVAAQEGGDRLTDSEIAVTCRLLLVAGNVTTTDLIGNGVLALLEHPAEMARLRAEPGLIGNAVEEMLRYDPPVVASSRTATAEGEICGVPVKAGQTIFTSLAGANRDPEVHADPGVFDVTRKGIDHLSFGGGVHFCLGANLARLEAVEGIGALLRRFPRLRLADAAKIVRSVRPGFRGLEALRVAVD